MVRFYPREWRARYGDEFAAMLADDIEERPRSVSRTLDLLRAASSARLSCAGLSGDALDGERQLRAGLVTIVVAAGVFLAAALAVWAQLTIGWRWAAPSAHWARSGMVLLTVAMALFAALAVAALAPLAWAAFRAALGGEVPGFRRSLLVLLAGLAILVAGSIYCDHGWPGSGGHEWAGRDLIPIAVARVCWSASFWVSTYWFHPGELLRFPLIELLWMVLSPLALTATLFGAAKTLRAMPLSAGMLRYESWVGAAVGLVMAAGLAGAASWVLLGSGASSSLYRAGAIDAGAIAVMGAMLVVAFKAARRNVCVRLATG